MRRVRVFLVWRLGSSFPNANQVGEIYSYLKDSAANVHIYIYIYEYIPADVYLRVPKKDEGGYLPYRNVYSEKPRKRGLDLLQDKGGRSTAQCQAPMSDGLISGPKNTLPLWELHHLR